MHDDIGLSNRGLLAALIAGSFAGAAAALLLAPRSSPHRRRQLATGIRHVLRSRARARAEAARRQASARATDKDRAVTGNSGLRPASSEKDRLRPEPADGAARREVRP